MSRELKGVPQGLLDTPGWIALTREKQKEIIGITSRLDHYRSMEGLGIVGQCIELAHARQALQGQPMDITDYTESVFQQGARTAWRRLAQFEELSQYWHEPITKALATRGATLLRGAAGSGMRELINVAKALPPPQSTESKVIEAFIEKDVRDKLREHRRGRKRGRTEPIENGEALKKALNVVLNLTKDVGTPDEQKEWLTNLTGYVMEARSIDGAVRASRKSIPDGFVVKRGPKPKK